MCFEINMRNVLREFAIINHIFKIEKRIKYMALHFGSKGYKLMQKILINIIPCGSGQ